MTFFDWWNVLWPGLIGGFIGVALVHGISYLLGRRRTKALEQAVNTRHENAKALLEKLKADRPSGGELPPGGLPPGHKLIGDPTIKPGDVVVVPFDMATGVTMGHIEVVEFRIGFNEGDWRRVARGHDTEA